MNNLKTVSSDHLWQQTKDLALEERRITTEILWHLKEIESRALHLARGYSSMHEYCVKELHYSDGSAYRRVEAMRLLEQFPEIETKIQQGSMNLSTVASIGTFFKSERKLGKTYSPDQKKDLLAQMEGKSRRQTDAILATLSPQSARLDRERTISTDQIEIRATISKTLHEKLERIKALNSHKKPNASHAELLELLADAYLEKRETASPAKLTDPKKPTRYIPKQTRKMVFRTHGEQCGYRDAKTGRRCESRHFLQIDHRTPFALGGTRNAENLRLLCGAHNRLEAARWGLRIPIH
ncbi:MAG: HNH endonuclease [Bdellovibrionota bacterium]